MYVQFTSCVYRGAILTESETFQNPKFLKCNMNQSFFSDIKMCQCHITTSCTCSPLVLLHLVLFLRFIFRPRQSRIQILTLAFAIRLLFICIFYGSIHSWLHTRTIDLSNDIEKNPGLRPSFSQIFSISHRNLNSVTAHSYVKSSVLKAYLSIHKFYIVCLSETNLDPSVPLHDVNLEIQGDELVRSSHPSQHKRGGVCIYFRNSLSLKILNIHYLQESKSFELQVGSKICKFVSLYRSPSQTSADFEKFTDNFELTLDTLAGSNSDLVVVL